MNLHRNFFPKLILSVLILVSNYAISQNVGIGTSTPVEKLDVNGNINVTGTIKANGVDGSPNQVLMKNASNVLTWGNTADFKKMVTFIDTSVSSIAWNVPAGVTRIWVEMWGAGGAGLEAGGGGGAYVSFFKDVTPGTGFTIEIGKGAKDDASVFPSAVFAKTGGFTKVSSAGLDVIAFGGLGAIKSTSSGYPQYIPGAGGQYMTSSSGVTEFFTLPGQSGSPVSIDYFLLPSNQYNRTTHFGKGGDAGHVPNSGPHGGVMVENINGASTTIVMKSFPTQSGGTFPGGGAPGMDRTILTNTQNGANGMVIIHY